jgi:ubiquinone/menaquinone biosynthesis C-methylase UbiE
MASMHDHPKSTRDVDVDHFDRWAASYDRSVLQPLLFTPTHAAVLNAAAEAGAHPNDVLDVGCGTAALLERALAGWPGAHFVGIDAAPNMIAEARRKHVGDLRFRFEVGDAAELPLERASVDVTFSTLSFHHWCQQTRGLREIARVLRPRGLFVLADIRPIWLLRPIMSRFHDAGARARLFEEAGFGVVDQRRPLRLGGQVLITVGRKA